MQCHVLSETLLGPTKLHLSFPPYPPALRPVIVVLIIWFSIYIFFLLESVCLHCSVLEITKFSAGAHRGFPKTFLKVFHRAPKVGSNLNVQEEKKSQMNYGVAIWYFSK